MKKNLLTILILFIFLLNYKVQAKEFNMKDKKVLIAYFSRVDEQYSVGNISEGNTAIVAKIIADKTKGDLFEIKLKNDNYPKEYRPLTAIAQKEKKENARPEIMGKVNKFADYDVVFVGSPNWWSDMPMAVYTFLEQYNWKDKKIIPFITHEGSGLSSIPTAIKNTTKAEVLDGLAVYGHEAQNERESTEIKVNNWLKKLGF